MSTELCSVLDAELDTALDTALDAGLDSELRAGSYAELDKGLDTEVDIGVDTWFSTKLATEPGSEIGAVFDIELGLSDEGRYGTELFSGVLLKTFSCGRVCKIEVISLSTPL